MHVEGDERWRLLLPASLKDGRAALDAPAQQSAELLAFKVANGHMSVAAVAQADSHLADLDPSLECKAKRLGLDEPVSLAWTDGERAAIYEIEVPRNQVRTLRVTGPTSLAWALFEPGADDGWRSLSNASAVGFAASGPLCCFTIPQSYPLDQPKSPSRTTA